MEDIQHKNTENKRVIVKSEEWGGGVKSCYNVYIPIIDEIMVVMVTSTYMNQNLQLAEWHSSKGST